LAQTSKIPVSIVILLLAGLTVGGVLSLVSTNYVPYFVGFFALLLIAFVSLLEPTFMLYFVILTSALAGMLRGFDSLQFGATQLTISGLRWAFVAAIVILLLVINARRLKIPRHLLLFLLFTLWVTTRWVSTSPNSVGMKEILFYGLPALVEMYTLLVLSSRPGITVLVRLERAMLYSVFIPIILYAIFIPTGLVQFTPSGPRGFFDPRPVALYSLVVLSLSLSNWRYGLRRAQRQWGALVSGLALSLIVFTLSRMAFATGILLFAIFLNSRRPRLWKLLVSGILATVMSVALLLTVPGLQTRLFHRSPSNVIEALEVLNTSGRDNMWQITYASASAKPILGWGPGSSSLLVGRTLFGAGEMPPHNEYLRIFHDAGLVGLFLALTAWLVLLAQLWKHWRVSHMSGEMLQAKWGMAATMGVLQILLSSLVDNTIQYTFIVAPVFIFVGCSYFLARHRQAAEPIPSTKQQGTVEFAQSGQSLQSG
jgi:O-antigen ligase